MKCATQLDQGDILDLPDAFARDAEYLAVYPLGNKISPASLSRETAPMRRSVVTTPVTKNMEMPPFSPLTTAHFKKQPEPGHALCYC